MLKNLEELHVYETHQEVHKLFLFNQLFEGLNLIQCVQIKYSANHT